jgi:ERCC4-type nuclease|tara:strand:- start:622 stop:1347 length:726 start_codon:yes stop_codon:yes gene_type:complete
VIYADDRENQTLLHALIARLGDSDYDRKGLVSIRRLNAGDYILGDWGIEAKEINDFYRSILGIGRTRNLNAQLADLCEAFETPMLVVYGTKLKPYFRGKVARAKVAQEIGKMRGVITNYKMNLYARFPSIRYMEFATMDEFVDWLATSHNRLTVRGALGAPRKSRRGRKASTDPRIIALSSIPGVSDESAKLLLSNFGTLKNIFLAKRTIKEFNEIPGISRITARRLKDMSAEFIGQNIHD